MEEAIAQLLKAGCVLVCASSPLVCSPMQVVISGGGKKQLVVDFRYVNQFLKKQKFQYESLELAP